jgi:hypothetical protein
MTILNKNLLIISSRTKIMKGEQKNYAGKKEVEEEEKVWLIK